LASLAWPAIAHWCRRLVDTLVALVLGKFVIVSVLSLAAGALAGGAGSTPSGAGGGSPGGGFAAVLGGAALLLLAAFAPWALFRLLPFLEAGAVGHLEGLSHRARHTLAAPARSLAVVAMRASVGGSAMASAAGMATAARMASGSRNPGGPAGPGDDGPPGTRPDPGPSSARSAGVGTMDAPGHNIPAWGVHPEATAAARRFMDDVPEGGWVDGGEEGPPTLGSLRPLPRQTGALRPDLLGSDELGVRLVAAPQLPVGGAPLPLAERPATSHPGRRDPGGDHGR
jgi:hypothetical protein